MAAATTLVLGGARSGKSDRARHLAESLGARRTILVTAQPFDAEMRSRIERHQAERDPSWNTIEAPLHLGDVLGSTADDSDVVLIDCLTLWLSNLMLGEHVVPRACDAFLVRLAACSVPLVIVSNEVGSGLVPENALGRRFRDEQGRLNRRVADAVARVELVVAGQVLVIKEAAVPA